MRGKMCVLSFDGKSAYKLACIYTRIVLRYYQIVADRSRCEGTKIIRCLVIDDTLLEKTGKCIEGITKVFDHVIHRTVLGLKMLVLGYWDGFNFVALDASLHNELGESGKGGLTPQRTTPSTQGKPG